MEEIWKPIPGFGGDYEVSNIGSVRSLKFRQPRLMKIHVQKSTGYPTLTLTMNGKFRPHHVHRLILLAFVGQPTGDEKQCRHLNGVRTDNRLENLAWGSVSENTIDQVEHGTHHHSRLTHCKRGHEFTPENTTTHAKGGRVCRVCRKIRWDRWYAENRASRYWKKPNTT
ncbi:NUMOD4 motif-containing HNH endonuclease [Nocardia sp. NBC_00565]|uniref:NUMOD4 domain-containing protein n=1 Tax=Nocardia sp. NBC_00565 TaxID=2975993 RepID=UPI002E80410A|nr:NUMOD4 domain-containing protein [Nocardia sp. NBC_00565]WUC03750.1 NUMOD4 motif-containing HNH endonuclease [Nocardia sp. NBC_00565]